MEKRYAAPDEVLYHIGFSANDIRGAKIAILPGDPGRVEGLARSISDEVEYVATHREYTSWLAWFEGTPILVCSTGMGGPSVGMVWKNWRVWGLPILFVLVLLVPSKTVLNLAK